jgi:hypothetical protein
MEAMDTLQAKLQECNHADMGGAAAAAKSAALITRLEGLRQELKSKMEALENLEFVRLRLKGQLADAKATGKKFDEEAKDTIMFDVVVLLGKKKLLELGETSMRRRRSFLGKTRRSWGL